MTQADYHADLARDLLRYVAAPAPIRPLVRRSALARRLYFAGKKVLVVGCARGQDCAYFVEYGAAEVHGLDVCADIGADLRHRKVRYHRCSAEEMALASDTFDLVYSIATMEHVPHIERAFAEMVRVTRPGGTIYCFAAPLWNSRDGHHKPELFGGEPWMHLRRSEAELVEHCQRAGVPSPDGQPIAEHVRFIFSAYFNRVPAARYVEVCRRLPVRQLVENALASDAPDTLPAPLRDELAARGYGPEELLAVCHKLVARK